MFKITLKLTFKAAAKIEERPYLYVVKLYSYV